MFHLPCRGAHSQVDTVSLGDCSHCGHLTISFLSLVHLASHRHVKGACQSAVPEKDQNSLVLGYFQD